jgi:hypothetical protein
MHPRKVVPDSLFRVQGPKVDELNDESLSLIGAYNTFDG